MRKKEAEGIEKIVKENEKWRSKCINLIASENIVSKQVKKVMNSDFMHRYAEGHPGKRYYHGTKFIDIIERKLKKDMKELFNCTQADVRPISGTNANGTVFGTYINSNDNVIVNSTPGGGHISHHKYGSIGKFTNNIIDFPLTKDRYHIDVDKTKDLICYCNPKMLIFGKSLFLFPEPINELREICKEKNIKIIYDAAHVLGLIAGRQFQDPLAEGADIMTASTHKTFFGTQRGVILSNLEANKWKKIDKNQFPGNVSNHHLDSLAGLAIATIETMEFGKDYAAQIVLNAQGLGKALDKYNFDVEAKEFGYTQSHQIAIDVKKYGGGREVSNILEKNDIIVNMNLLPSKETKYTSNPRGIRIGTPEITRLGMKENDMIKVAELIKECVIDRKFIKKEVNKFRQNFQNIKYSFEDFKNAVD